MVINGGLNSWLTRLNLRNKTQQRPPVIRLRETLAVHYASPFQLGIGQQKTIGRNELNTRSLWPTRQQFTQQTRGRRLTHRDRASYTDHIGRSMPVLTQERASGLV